MMDCNGNNLKVVSAIKSDGGLHHKTKKKTMRYLCTVYCNWVDLKVV